MRNYRASSKKKNDESESDLHSAARSGNLQIVESICSLNPLAINSRDKHSRTPTTLNYFLDKNDLKPRLHLAAWSGQTEVVNYLCKHKADVGAAAMDDTAAIHFASQKGHLEVVRALFSAGSSVKASTRKGLTPLHFAVQGSHLELVKYLVRKGANLGAKTKSGQIPLDLATSEEVRSYLVECEESSKKGDKSKVDNPEPQKQSDAKEEESDVKEKRRGEEIAEESLSGSKKARVSLQHLIAEDDAQDAEEQ